MLSTGSFNMYSSDVEEEAASESSCWFQNVPKWWNAVINYNTMQFYAENTDEEWEMTDSACDEQAQDDGEYEFKEEWLATYPDMQAQPLQEQDWPSPVYIRQVYKRKRPAC